jgi:hypothetical protein
VNAVIKEFVIKKLGHAFVRMDLLERPVNEVPVLMIAAVMVAA